MLTTADAEKLLDALLPFARYAQQMEHRWGYHDDSVHYGVKTGFSVTYGDYRKAAKLLRELEGRKDLRDEVKI